MAWENDGAVETRAGDGIRIGQDDLYLRFVGLQETHCSCVEKRFRIARAVVQKAKPAQLKSLIGFEAGPALDGVEVRGSGEDRYAHEQRFPEAVPFKQSVLLHLVDRRARVMVPFDEFAGYRIFDWEDFVEVRIYRFG